MQDELGCDSMFLFCEHSCVIKIVGTMSYFKYLHFIFPAIIVLIVLSIVIRNYKNGRIEKQILSNPIYVSGTITEIVPDTPSKLGVVNIETDYEFNSENGKAYRKKHARTVIKTMDLHHYKVGVNIPIIYLKTDPSRNMINVKSEMSL